MLCAEGRVHGQWEGTSWVGMSAWPPQGGHVGRSPVGAHPASRPPRGLSHSGCDWASLGAILALPSLSHILNVLPHILMHTFHILVPASAPASWCPL